MSPSTASVGRPKITAHNQWTRLGVSIGLALAVNLAVYLVGNAAVDGSIQVMNPSTGVTEDLPLVALIMASIIPVALGIAFLAAAERFWKLAPALAVVGIVTLLSLGAVYSLDVGSDSKIALTIMHLATGSAVIGTALRVSSTDR